MCVGIHLMNKGCRTNAVNFCSSVSLLIISFRFSKNHHSLFIFLSLFFAFHLINFDWNCLFMIFGLPSNQLESVEFDSSFIGLLLCWTSNVTICYDFDQTDAAVSQIAGEKHNKFFISLSFFPCSFFISKQHSYRVWMQ